MIIAQLEEQEEKWSMTIRPKEGHVLLENKRTTKYPLNIVFLSPFFLQTTT